jgi:hypothetical protein
MENVNTSSRVETSLEGRRVKLYGYKIVLIAMAVLIAACFGVYQLLVWNLNKSLEQAKISQDFVKANAATLSPVGLMEIDKQLKVKSITQIGTRGYEIGYTTADSDLLRNIQTGPRKIQVFMHETAGNSYLARTQDHIDGMDVVDMYELHVYNDVKIAQGQPTSGKNNDKVFGK